MYKRQVFLLRGDPDAALAFIHAAVLALHERGQRAGLLLPLSLIHISEPTRPY